MVASQLFGPAERAAIAAAVADAEKKTSGEIVPVVASTSDRYERAEDLCGLTFAVLALGIAWILGQDVRPVAGEWRSGWEPSLGLFEILAIVVGAWVAGVLVARRAPAVKRLFAGRWFMNPRVEAAATDAFGRFHVRRTAGATGIVIYVSLFERRVCIKADRAISEKVAASEWTAICDGLVRAMGERRHREGFVESIGKCGALLARHFPIQPGDANELSNELRIVDRA
jgi:putative membrane protein